MRIHPALFATLFAFATVSMPAQSTPAENPAAGSAARIVFTFDHPQLQPAHYSITVEESGAGQFSSRPGSASDAGDDVMPAPLDRPIQIDATLRNELFAWARAHNFFNTRCTTTRTSLAFTGNKTLAYTGPDGSGSCKFVWAEDPALGRLADQLGAVAFTLEEGRRLEVEVRHDRLGLDAELENLQEAYKDHRAADLTNIAEQLHAVADDPQVMNRARKRAQELLAYCDASGKG